jgi:hypothetical protein
MGVVSAQEMVDRSQVTTVAASAFGCVAVCNVSPKKAQRELKPMQFVCQCDDQLAGFAGFAGDVQEAKKQLRLARDAISKRTGVSAAVSQSAAALADAMMVSAQVCRAHAHPTPLPAYRVLLSAAELGCRRSTIDRQHAVGWSRAVARCPPASAVPHRSCRRLQSVEGETKTATLSSRPWR